MIEGGTTALELALPTLKESRKPRVLQKEKCWGKENTSYLMERKWLRIP
jgi:hypothetical protein